MLGFTTPTTVSVPATGSVPFAVFRQACYPVWGPTSLPAKVGSATTYLMDSGPTNAIAVSEITYNCQPLCLQDYTVSDRTASTSVVGLSGTGAWPLTLTNPIIGKDCGRYWVYVPVGAIMNFVVSGAAPWPGNCTFTANYLIWASPGEYTTASVDGTVTGGQCGGPSSAVLVSSTVYQQGVWVCPSTVVFSASVQATLPTAVYTTVVWGNGTLVYSGSTTTRGTATIAGGSSAVSHFPLVEPTEYVNSKMPWYSTRTTAASLLLTNVTQVLNKGGTALAGRMSPAVQNAWNVKSSTINQLHPAEKAFLPLETGLYTYVAPSTDLQVFTDYTTVGTTTAPACPLFDLSNDSLYNFVFLTSAGVIEGIAVTADWHIEFRTTSALFNIGTTTVSLETLHQAQLVLNELGFFFENPRHKSILTRLIAAARRYVPQAIGVFNPEMGKVARRAVRFLSGKPQGKRKRKTVVVKVAKMPSVQKPKANNNKIVTTSANRSGFNPPGKRQGGLDMYLRSKGMA